MLQSTAFNLFTSRISVIGLNFFIFVLTARALGPANLGVFGSSVSIALIVAALSQVGAGTRLFELFHKHKVEPRVAFGNIVFSSQILICVNVLASLLFDVFAGVPTKTVVLIYIYIISEAFLISTRANLEFYFNLTSQKSFLRWVGFSSVFPKCIVCAVLFEYATLEYWLMGLSIANITSILFFYSVLFLKKSLPIFRAKTFLLAVPLGLKAGFSVSMSTVSFQMIRPILLQFVSPAQVGQVVLPQRVSQLGTLPIATYLQSVLSLTFSNRNSKSVREVLNSYRRTLKIAIVLIALGFAGVMFGFPLIVHFFLGPAYADSVPMMRLFAIVAVSRSFVLISTNMNIALNNETKQMGVSFAAFCTTITVFLGLVEGFEWKAAVFAIVAGDLTFTLGSMFLVIQAYRRCTDNPSQ